MARYGDFYQNKVTGERGVVLRGDEDSGDQPALVHLVVQPHGRWPASIFTRGSRSRSRSSPAGSGRAWMGSNGCLPPVRRR